MLWEGVLNLLTRRMRETSSDRARRYYARFFSSRSCRACGGTRLRPEALAVNVGDHTIADVSSMSIEDALGFMGNLELEGAALVIGAELLKEIRNRLRFLADVGLGYLSLDRLAPSLSGGESQRIRLASQIGSELTGVIYILDEPSIGLHPRDNGKLLEALHRLRDIGNTVVVVEHDRETIESADHVLDFGPGSRGLRGGGGGRRDSCGDPGRAEVAHGTLSARRPRHRGAPAPAALPALGPDRGGPREQPQGSGRGDSAGRPHLRHRSLGRRQEHARLRGALPGARPCAPPLRATGGEALPHRRDRTGRPGGGHRPVPDRPHPTVESGDLHEGVRRHPFALRGASRGPRAGLQAGALLLQRARRAVRTLSG